MNTTNPKLFDDLIMRHTRYASYAEPNFQYMNESGRDIYQNIRQALETWFYYYPHKSAQHLFGSFRSKNDVAHQGAFFELLLHEILRRMNCKIKIEPVMPNGKRPDFLVTEPNNSSFYMECVVPLCEPPAQVKARERVNQLYDILNNRLDLPNFWLGLSIVGQPKTPVPSSKLINTIIRATKKSIVPPKIKFDHDGMTLTISFIKKPPEAPRNSMRSIGIRVDGEAHLVRTNEFVRPTLIGKTKKYGTTFDIPYIIAVNILDPLNSSIDDREIVDLLFGNQTITSRFEFNETQTEGVYRDRLIRQQNGLFVGPNGTRNCVSAVIVGVGINPENMSGKELRIYHNPWAIIPFPKESALNALPRWSALGGALSGNNLGRILGIHAFNEQNI